MNIIKQEIKMSYKSLIGYTVGIMILFTIFLVFFESFKEGASIIDKVLQNFPSEFKAAFGFSNVNLSEFTGYLSFLFSYVVLIGAVFAMKLGVTVLSEESRVKTADFLLSKPAKRHQIVTSKLVAVLILLALQNIITFGYTFTMSLIIIKEGFDARIFVLMSLSVFLVQLFFAGVGMLLSVVINKIKNVTPITLGVVFMFFIIDMVNESLLVEKLTYITPFAYFKGASILNKSALDMKYVILDLVLFVFFTAISYVIYTKKDIHSV